MVNENGTIVISTESELEWHIKERVYFAKKLNEAIDSFFEVMEKVNKCENIVIAESLKESDKNVPTDIQIDLATSAMLKLADLCDLITEENIDTDEVRNDMNNIRKLRNLSVK